MEKGVVIDTDTRSYHIIGRISLAYPQTLQGPDIRYELTWLIVRATRVSLPPIARWAPCASVPVPS